LHWNGLRVFSANRKAKGKTNDASPHPKRLARQSQEFQQADEEDPRAGCLLGSDTRPAAIEKTSELSSGSLQDCQCIKELKMVFETGDRVLTPCGPGTVVSKRMSPPDYSQVASYSVKVDVNANNPIYVGTVYSADQSRAIGGKR
jgi:hypothetical protein